MRPDRAQPFHTCPNCARRKPCNSRWPTASVLIVLMLVAAYLITNHEAWLPVIHAGVK